MFNGLPSEHKLNWHTGYTNSCIKLPEADAMIGSTMFEVILQIDGVGFSHWELESKLLDVGLKTTGLEANVWEACLEAETLILEELEKLANGFGKELKTIRPDVRQAYPFN